MLEVAIRANLPQFKPEMSIRLPGIYGMGDYTNPDLVGLCQRVVEQAKISFGGANPTIMLLENDSKGRSCLVPYGIALPPTIIKWGQMVLGEKLGEHKGILVDADSKNDFVKAHLEQGDEPKIIISTNIGPAEFMKIACDFIDRRIEGNSSLEKLYRTALATFEVLSYFGEENTLMMVPLRVTDSSGRLWRKIGILAILVRGKPSQKQLDEVQIFADVASAQIYRCQELQTKNAQLEAKVRELDEALAKLQAAQDALIHQERVAAMGELAAGVSHQIKNLLLAQNSLLEERELLTQKAEVCEELIELRNGQRLPVGECLKSLRQVQGRVKEIDEGMRQSIHEAGQTVQGMLAFAACGSNQPSILLLKQHIIKDQTLMAIIKDARRHNVIVEIDDSALEETDAVLIPESDLSEVLRNLLLNGIQSFRELPSSIIQKNQVWLRLERNGDSIAFTIEDNGPGIESTRLSDLFRSIGRTTKPTGSGIGLVHVDRIVKKNDGKIACASVYYKDDKKNHGTKFTVTFPRQQSSPLGRGVEDERMTADQPSPFYPGYLPKGYLQKRIMIVEDVDVIRNRFCRELHILGFQDVKAFASPEMALEALERGENLTLFPLT